MGILKMLLGEEPNPLDKLTHSFNGKGEYGEYLTEYALTNDNVEGYNKVIRNAYIKDRDKSIEIDLIMVHEKGIFVFESKNYSGWIFGDINQKRWTQTMPNGDKFSFYNPIMQNEVHRKALAVFLSVPLKSLSSYIIFSERCNLKSVPDDTETFKIVYRDYLLKTLLRDLETKKVVFTHEQVDDLMNKLIVSSNLTDEQKEQHILDIANRRDKLKCPYCGGDLVLRNGKYGQFYGCKNYPKCKYTKPYEK